MAISRWAAVHDAVLTKVRASTDPAMSGVEVFDGPPYGDNLPMRAVYVGWTGDPEDDNAGTVRQSVHDAGAGTSARRDEEIVIQCMCEAFSGDDDLVSLRGVAVGILGAVETALRSDFTLGLEYVLRVEMDSADVFQARTPQGSRVAFGFALTATCLI